MLTLVHKQALEILAILTACYPSTKINQATANIYLNFLSQFDYETAKKAVHQIVLTSQYFPSLADLYQALNSFSKKEIPGINEAWAEVMRKIQTIGIYGSPSFSHQAILDAVSVIGWRNICMSENISVERAHFMKIYEAVKKRYEEEQIKQQAERISLINPASAERKAINGY